MKSAGEKKIELNRFLPNASAVNGNPIRATSILASLDTAARDKLILDDPIPVLFLDTAPNLFGAESAARTLSPLLPTAADFHSRFFPICVGGNAHPSQGDDPLPQFDDPIAVLLSLNSGMTSMHGRQVVMEKSIPLPRSVGEAAGIVQRPDFARATVTSARKALQGFQLSLSK